jgi:acyl carrier protein
MKSADDFEQWIIERVRSLFGLSNTNISGAASFDEIGADSLTRAVLIREIEETFNVSLAEGIIEDFPTIRSLSVHLAGLLSR